MAFTISMSAVAASDIAISMGAPVAMASMMQDGSCHPAPKTPGCDKANLCELMCLVSAFAMPADPIGVAVLDRSEQASAPASDLLTGIASPIDPSPPRLTSIA